MHVQMRHALTDPVVQGEEGTLRLQPVLDRARNQPRGSEHGRKQMVREFGQQFVMFLRTDETMSGKYGTVVQEDCHLFVFVDPAGIDLAPKYPAEHTR